MRPPQRRPELLRGKRTNRLSNPRRGRWAVKPARPVYRRTPPPPCAPVVFTKHAGGGCRTMRITYTDIPFRNSRSGHRVLLSSAHTHCQGHVSQNVKRGARNEVTFGVTHSSRAAIERAHTYVGRIGVQHRQSARTRLNSVGDGARVLGSASPCTQQRPGHRRLLSSLTKALQVASRLRRDHPTTRRRGLHNGLSIMRTSSMAPAITPDCVDAESRNRPSGRYTSSNHTHALARAGARARHTRWHASAPLRARGVSWRRAIASI